MARLQYIDGTTIIDDIRLGHTLFESGVLNKFVTSEHPEYFIEIGVHEGGLSYVLMPFLLSKGIKYIGVELNCALIRQAVRDMYNVNATNAQLYCMDCFSSGLYNKISALGRKIIYCDGGNKPRELHHFKSACNSGDIIMAHDFHDGIRIVKDVLEVHAEVVLSDIEVFDSDATFERLDETIFNETRIVGWRKL